MVIRSLAIVCFLATVAAFALGGPSSVLTLPVVIQCVLVILGTELSERTRRAVPFNGIILVTIVELLRGCVVPVLLQFFGQENPVYRQLGSYADGFQVLLVANVFYLSFLVASAVFSVPRRPEPARLTQSLSGRPRITAGASALIGLGLIGLLMRFPTVESVTSFLAGDYDSLQSSASGGIFGFIAAVLRPLLPLGIALLIVERKRRSERAILLLAVLSTSFFALGSYGLNRSTIIFPVIAFAVAYAGVIGLRLRKRTTAMLGGTLITGFFILGAVRENLYAARLGQSGISEGPVAELVQTVLIYGQSPLQSAPALLAQSRSPQWDLTSLWHSVLSPIPGVSDLMRSGSGTTIYNSLLYQNTTSKDQILPSWLETYLSMGVLGPIALGFLAAAGMWLLDRRRRQASSLLGAYGLALAAIWIAQLSVNSLSGVGQGLIYFAATPVVLSLAMRKSSLFQPTPDPASKHAERVDP